MSRDSQADFLPDDVEPPSELFSGVDDIGQPAEVEPLTCIDVRDLDVLDLPVPAFVVDYLFPEGAVVLLSGDSGSCKSSFASHVGLAVALGKTVGGKLATKPDAGPVMYFNGEQNPSQIQAANRQAAAGLDARLSDVAKDRFWFVGDQGMAEFRFGIDAKGLGLRARVEATIRDARPSLVIIDTLRQLFDIDEKEATQVRAALSWLKHMATVYGCCIAVLHHLRKAGERNGQRERVSGSSDLIAVPDVHLQAISNSGQPMHALYVDKTRFAKDGVRAGTQFPVDAQFETPSSSGDVGLSTFVIGMPTIANMEIETETSHERDLLALFAEKRMLTRNDAGAGDKGSGSMKRAWTALAKRGRIVKTEQKRGKSDLWERAGDRDELFSHSDDDEPGHKPGQPSGQVVAKLAQRPAVQGIQPGQRTGPAVGPDTARDRPDVREAPATPRAGAPVSHQGGDPTGPTGPTYIEWPGKSGPVGGAGKPFAIVEADV